MRSPLALAKAPGSSLLYPRTRGRYQDLESTRLEPMGLTSSEAWLLPARKGQVLGLHLWQGLQLPWLGTSGGVCRDVGELHTRPCRA